MDVKFINHFVSSVKKVFATMVGTELTIGQPSVLNALEQPQADVSAVIGLSGDVVGCMVLSLPMATAVNAASKFASIEMDQDHADFSDAIGELANMVAGQAKAKFEGLNSSISLPGVIIGPNHVVSQSRQAPRLAIPCGSTLGDFTIEVAMVVEKQQDGSAAEYKAATAAH